jgi:hypothetical protein
MVASFRQFSGELTESGMSFSGIQTSRISKENIEPTVNSVLAKLKKYGYRRSDLSLLGSTGKKESSGDIDVGIHTEPLLNATNMSEIGPALKKLQSYLAGFYGDVKFIFGMQLSMGVPVVGSSGRPTGEFCQVDLMFTPSLETSSFYYHSPAQSESQYKGAYRTTLLFAIAIEHQRVDLGDGREERYWFDKWYGLLKGVEAKVGNKRVASDKEMVTNVPDEIVQILLGPSFTVADCNSFESIWKAIHSSKFVGKSTLSRVVSTFKDICNKQKMPLPSGV